MKKIIKRERTIIELEGMVICPICGQKGLKREYVCDNTVYLHRPYKEMGFTNFETSCVIRSKND
jgi:hypothetical protein